MPTSNTTAITPLPIFLDIVFTHYAVGNSVGTTIKLIGQLQ